MVREVGDGREGAQPRSHHNSAAEALDSRPPALTCHIPKPQEFLLLTSAGAKVFQQVWVLKAVVKNKSTVLDFKIRFCRLEHTAGGRGRRVHQPGTRHLVP